MTENLEPDENVNGENADKRVASNKFSATNQPSGAAKSMGWWRKKRGRKMLKAIMELPFNSLIDDSATGQKIPNPIKKQAADYLGIPEIAVSVEMIMSIKQMALAIQKNDTGAFNSVWEKAYGKPKEELDEREIPPPVINVYILAPGEEVPEIKETEHEKTKEDEESSD